MAPGGDEEDHDSNQWYARGLTSFKKTFISNNVEIWKIKSNRKKMENLLGFRIAVFEFFNICFRELFIKRSVFYTGVFHFLSGTRKLVRLHNQKQYVLKYVHSIEPRWCVSATLGPLLHLLHCSQVIIILLWSATVHRYFYCRSNNAE